MSGTQSPAIDADIKLFVDRIGASIPLIENEAYATFRKVFKKQNYFKLGRTFLVVKISRSDRPFWGLTKDIIDFIDGLDDYFVVLLTSPSDGWIFSKAEVASNIRSESWGLAADGNYKINSPLPLGNAFSTASAAISMMSADA